MRLISLSYIAFVLACVFATSLHAEFSAAGCEAVAKGTAALAETAKGAAKGVASSSFVPISTDSSGELKKAALRAERGRERLIAALREYQAAVEDLTYQLNVCAR